MSSAQFRKLNSDLKSVIIKGESSLLFSRASRHRACSCFNTEVRVSLRVCVWVCDCVKYGFGGIWRVSTGQISPRDVPLGIKQ